MAGGQHGALDDEDVGTGFLSQLGTLRGPGGNRRDGTRDAGSLDRVDPLRDELGFDGLSVDLFEERVDVRFVRLRDSLDDRSGVFVTSVDSVKVQDGDPAELAHGDGKFDVDDAIHGGTPDLDRKLEPVTQRERDVDFVRVESHATGHQRHLVETVGAARVAPDAKLKARLLPGSHSAGCEPTLIQGVLTPMAAGFSKLYENLRRATRESQWCGGWPHILYPCTGRSSTCAGYPTTTFDACGRAASSTPISSCTAPRLESIGSGSPRKPASLPSASSNLRISARSSKSREWSASSLSSAASASSQ